MPLESSETIKAIKMAILKFEKIDSHLYSSLGFSINGPSESIGILCSWISSANIEKNVEHRSLNN